MRSGYGRSLFEPLLPFILGCDISGEVAAFGGSAHSFSVDQEVFGALHPTAVRGTYTDYAILAEDGLTSMHMRNMLIVDGFLVLGARPEVDVKGRSSSQNRKGIDLGFNEIDNGGL
ncbi:reticulon-4-interacting 1, mitochondrial [Olea europaea subsp. europaea]|uniref:Reticulon-4-interacting 1, mitochondrial n=1 Tax=Olea europaea subsp. europaea TaxID=158383 RepID=A0A8S0REG4_OLEEU|nr:reticulon-4-interacting 1, mitochondrial [Olea europaea subsp. europaea]